MSRYKKLSPRHFLSPSPFTLFPLPRLTPHFTVARSHIFTSNSLQPFTVNSSTLRHDVHSFYRPPLHRRWPKPHRHHRTPRTWCIPCLKHATPSYENFSTAISTYAKSADGLLALSIAAGLSVDPLMSTEGYSAVNQVRSIFAKSEPTEKEWSQFYETTHRLAGGITEAP